MGSIPAEGSKLFPKNFHPVPIIYFIFIALAIFKILNTLPRLNSVLAVGGFIGPGGVGGSTEKQTTKLVL